MSMQELQDIRKKRARLSAERHELKEESQKLRIAERTAKNSLLLDYLEQGNFAVTHGNVKRIRPRYYGSMSNEMRDMMDDWRNQCRAYDEARQLLIQQKIELLDKLKDMSSDVDMTNFFAINFKGKK